MNLLFIPWLPYHSYTNYHRWNILIFNNLVILNLDSHNGLILDMSNMSLPTTRNAREPFHSFYQKASLLTSNRTSSAPPSSVYNGRTSNSQTTIPTLNQEVQAWQRKDKRDHLDSLRRKDSERIQQSSGKVQPKDCEPGRHRGGKAPRSWTQECRQV